MEDGRLARPDLHIAAKVGADATMRIFDPA